MKRIVFILLIGLIAMPVGSASANLRSASVEGSEVAALTNEGQAALMPKDKLGMEVSGIAWEVKVVKEVVNSSVPYPGRPGEYIFAVHEAKDSEFSMADGNVVLSRTGSDAIVIIDSLGTSTSMMAEHHGQFAVNSISSKILESSHALSPDMVPRHPRYYEYEAADTLEVAFNGRTEFAAKGNLALYVWGFDLAFNEQGQVRHVQTGHDPGNDGIAGTQPPTRSETFTYAILTIHDATLSYVAEGSVGLYSDRLQGTAPGTVAFEDAQGSVPGHDGEYAVHGSTAVSGGSFQWSHESDGSIGVKFLGAPGEVRGDSVSFQPLPLVERSWFLPVALAVMAVIAMVAAYLAPAVAGRRSADAGPGLGGLRTAGFRRWAAAADDRGRLRRAAFWAGRAHRNAPHDWDATLERAIYLAQVGRFSKALALHESAHGGFQFLGDAEQLAHNAYEAARSAARLRRDEDAVDWLRVAVEADPGLATDMASDPSFATLRAFPDYLSLRGPVAQMQVRP